MFIELMRRSAQAEADLRYLARPPEVLTMYTPDRTAPEALFPGSSKDMIIVHTGDLELGSVREVGGRKMRIDRETDKEEFLTRCPHVPRLLGIDRYRFFVAMPVEEETRRMAAKVRDLHPQGPEHYFAFYCPGCTHNHKFRVGGSQEPRWDFNNSLERPTFHPSLLINKDSPETRCHLFLRDGKIEYQKDCFHKLAETTVECPDWEGEDYS